MKIAIITDTHIGARGDSLVFDQYFADFFNDVFFPYLKREQIEHVIHLGDTFDRRKYINYGTLSAAKKYYIDPLKEFKSWTILGNHDVYYKTTNEINSASLLLDGATNVVSEPETIVMDDLPILLIPWICPENEKRVMSAVAESSAPFLGGHLGLSGYEGRRGHVVTDAMSDKPFKKFDTVLTGHYHHKSSVGNIHYLGTPYEIDWSDYNDQKGFHVLDTRTRELEYIPTESNMFFRITYDDDTAAAMIDNGEVITDFSSLKDRIVKVVVKSRSNAYVLDKIITKMENSDLFSLQVIEDHASYDDDIDVDSIIDEAEDTLSIFKKTINQLSVDESYKNKLVNLASDLYKEASSV